MKKLVADNAVRTQSDDALGRTDAAHLFVEQVLIVDASEGLVVGVIGPWGSGKTSFINLTRKAFADAGAPVVDFNPWMFSGADQLVDYFFTEIGAELKQRPDLAQVGDLFSQYGELFGGLAWVPIAGPWIERARAVNKAFSAALQRRRAGSRDQRERLQKTLRQRTTPIIVVIDDIDRLTSAEIREIFKLVRLTANFPNIVYMLAFDRARVESALDEENVPGRSYLEKIVQFDIDLPTLPTELLFTRTLGAIQDSLDTADIDGPFNKNAWPDTFSEIVFPLISTMRDVRRLAISLYGTMRSLGKNVDTGDLIALDAVRIFLPDVYSRLSSSVAGLTATQPLGLYGKQEPPELKESVQAVLSSAPAGREEIVKAFLTRMFPAAGGRIGGGAMSYGADFESTWLLGRRIAHRDILRLALERAINSGLSSHMSAETALLAMSNVDDFAAYFDRLNDEEVADVLAALSNLNQSFIDEQVVPALAVSHNLLTRLKPKAVGIATIDGRFIVGRFTYVLLERRSDDPDKVVDMIQQALPKIVTLYGKYELITSVGHRENVGHKFISGEAADALETEWRSQVRAASADALAAEQHLLYMLLRARAWAKDGEPELVVPEDAKVTLSVLRSAVSEVRSSGIGNRAVYRDARLDWVNLIALFGSETELVARINVARASAGADDGELFELIDRYISGWRPKDF